MAKYLLLSLVLLFIVKLISANEQENEQFLNAFSELLNTDLFKPADLNLKGVPKVVWPKKFSMQMSTNTMIYNTTINMRFDSVKNRIWTQVNYTSPIFGNYEAFQMSVFPNDRNVSLKIDDECRWTNVYESAYIYLNLIFNSWSYYTKYIGINSDNLHEFHIIDYIKSQRMGNITFLFKEFEGKDVLQLAFVGVSSKSLPTPLLMTVIEPPTERPEFTDKGKDNFIN